MLAFTFTVPGIIAFAFISLVLLGMYFLSRPQRRLTLQERNQLRAELGEKRPAIRRTSVKRLGRA